MEGPGDGAETGGVFTGLASWEGTSPATTATPVCADTIVKHGVSDSVLLPTAFNTDAEAVWVGGEHTNEDTGGQQSQSHSGARPSPATDTGQREPQQGRARCSQHWSKTVPGLNSEHCGERNAVCRKHREGSAGQERDEKECTQEVRGNRRLVTAIPTGHAGELVELRCSPEIRDLGQHRLFVQGSEPRFDHI